MAARRSTCSVVPELLGKQRSGRSQPSDRHFCQRFRGSSPAYVCHRHGRERALLGRRLVRSIDRARGHLSQSGHRRSSQLWHSLGRAGCLLGLAGRWPHARAAWPVLEYLLAQRAYLWAEGQRHDCLLGQERRGPSHAAKRFVPRCFSGYAPQLRGARERRARLLGKRQQRASERALGQLRECVRRR